MLNVPSTAPDAVASAVFLTLFIATVSSAEPGLDNFIDSRSAFVIMYDPPRPKHNAPTTFMVVFIIEVNSAEENTLLGPDNRRAALRVRDNGDRMVRIIGDESVSDTVFEYFSF